MRACESRVATSANACEDTASSKTTRAISAVSPEGPGAAPFRARRKLVSNALLSSATGDGGCHASKSRASGPYGSGGRRLGSESCSKVAFGGRCKRIGCQRLPGGGQLPKVCEVHCSSCPRIVRGCRAVGKGFLKQRSPVIRRTLGTWQEEQVLEHGHHRPACATAFEEGGTRVSRPGPNQVQLEHGRRTESNPKPNEGSFATHLYKNAGGPGTGDKAAQGYPQLQKGQGSPRMPGSATGHQRRGHVHGTVHQAWAEGQLRPGCWSWSS